jgi:hypothetical protein
MLPPGYLLTQTLIGSAKKIIKSYDYACRAALSCGKLSGTEAAKDSDCWKLTNLLETRRKDVKYQINSSLYGTAGFSKEVSAANMSRAEESDVWTSFAKDDEDEKDQSTDESKAGYWARAAKQAERGIRRIVKHLPEDI